MAAVSGKRARRYLQRQHLIDLGAAALAYLTELTHRRPPAALIDDLSAAFRAGELANALPTYTHPAVLLVDEVGYLTYGTDAANMLFHVVNERHRRHRR